MATTIAEPPHLAADLKTLCLSTIGAQWRLLAEQAARQRQAPADYLAQLVHLEVTGRRERRIQRRIQDARFPMLKTLDAFSFEAQPDLDRDAILQVFDCRFVADAANVVFVGGVGTGKTHLSIALGMTCCQHDYRVRFVTAAELVLVLHPAVPDPRIHETGYRVGAWRWPRGRFLYGAKSPFFSWTRSPASTPYCETGDSSGERAL